MGKWIIKERMQGGIREKWKRCSKCGWEHALLIPSKFCPNCGEHNDDFDYIPTRAEVIRENMTNLIHSYEENKDDPDIMYWCDEYGGDYLYGIDCHVVFEGDPPCLLDERGLSFDPKDSKERIKRDEACAECKAIWLMGRYE